MSDAEKLAVDLPKMMAPDPVKEPSKLIFDPKALSVVSEPFNFDDPQMDPIELASMLVKEMVDSKGLGLSAIQIGIPLRVFAITTRPQHTVLFNPTIVHVSDETRTDFEGCLSFPNLIIKVKRPFEIRMRYKQANQEVITVKWGGLTARCAQHEMDHLNGLLFYNQAGKFHRDQGFRKKEQYDRALKAYNKAHGPKRSGASSLFAEQS